jgi:hypothetical protein
MVRTLSHVFQLSARCTNPRSHAGPEPVLLLALAKDLLLHSHGSHSALCHNTHRGHSTRRIVGCFALLIRGHDVTEIGFVAAQHIAIRGGPQMNRRAAYQNVHPRHDGGIDVHNLLNIMCVQVTFNEGVQGLIGCNWAVGPASTIRGYETTAGFNLQIQSTLELLACVKLLVATEVNAHVHGDTGDTHL